MTDPAPASRFNVIIVLDRVAEWARPCIAATLAQSLPPRQVTLVDNLSARRPDDRALKDLLSAFPGIKVMRMKEPLGYAACCNKAAAAAHDADFHLLLDGEAVPALHTLERLARAFRHLHSAAILGCKVLGDDVETLRHLGSDMRGNGLPRHHGAGEHDRGQYQGLHDALSVQSVAFAVRSEVWCELGGLDESFWPSYFEVADFCFRARSAHWRVAVACDATVTHFGPQIPQQLDSAGRAMFFRNRARFLRKHYRATHWLTRFLPDELRWLAGRDSHGMKTVALRETLLGLFDQTPARPQSV